MIPASTITAATTHERDDLGAVAVAPAEPLEDRRRRQRRQRDEHGLPADQQHVGHQRRAGVLPPAPERRARQHERRRGAALAGDRDQADEEERQRRHPPSQAMIACHSPIPKPEHERAVRHREHRDVGGAPGPEQPGRLARALGLVDDVDAVGLDPAPAPPVPDVSAPRSWSCRSSPQQVRQQRTGPCRCLLCDNDHLARVDSRIVALDGGHRREPDHLDPAFSRHDRLGDRRHPEHVRPAYVVPTRPRRTSRSAAPAARRRPPRRATGPGRGPGPAAAATSSR